MPEWVRNTILFVLGAAMNEFGFLSILVLAGAAFLIKRLDAQKEIDLATHQKDKELALATMLDRRKQYTLKSGDLEVTVGTPSKEKQSDNVTWTRGFSGAMSCRYVRPDWMKEMGDTANEFTKGDQVRAIGSTRAMTVEEVYSSAFIYRYRCAWMDDDGCPEHELFRPEQLEPVD
jgi:uncharacterized protein YodC (DUF2158 family)